MLSAASKDLKKANDFSVKIWGHSRSSNMFPWESQLYVHFGKIKSERHLTFVYMTPEASSTMRALSGCFE